MRISPATVIATEQLDAQHSRTLLAVPEVGIIGPGQGLLLSGTRPTWPAMVPATIFASAFDHAARTLETLWPLAEPGLRWLLDQELADAQHLQAWGPVGHGFSVQGGTRRALLAADCRSLSALVYLARELAARGVEVCFVVANRLPAGSWPATLMPPEIEVLVDTTADGTETLRQIERLALWADQLFLGLPDTLYLPVQNVLRRQLLRQRRGFAQVLLGADSLPCGTGACSLCAITVRQGLRYRCKDGPVFDLLALL